MTLEDCCYDANYVYGVMQFCDGGEMYVYIHTYICVCVCVFKCLSLVLTLTPRPLPSPPLPSPLSPRYDMISPEPDAVQPLGEDEARSYFKVCVCVRVCVLLSARVSHSH